ncbi:hypothetical protein KJY73_17815 [Bowmanella sp. Y26]|uniref:hypothetical protein n=1 Tax=Bowmanella yangjiangensis TaxID=2811230 RepID=UPI001BDC0008|nr:hypothetical protein [Bowmanella yangjiangensis]MBT1065449.1 hypothetical protein [Bowmanella yangjiangensis]
MVLIYKVSINVINFLLLIALLQLPGAVAQTEPLSVKAQPGQAETLWQRLSDSIMKTDELTPSGLIYSPSQPNHFALLPLQDPHAFTQLISQMQQAEDFSIEEINLPAGKLINLIYDVSTWERFGVGLFYQHGTWYRFYHAGVSSKNFTPMFDLSLVGNNQVEAILCIADCSWWGRNALVLLDMQALRVDIIEEVSMSYLDWVNQ